MMLPPGAAHMSAWVWVCSRQRCCDAVNSTLCLQHVRYLLHWRSQSAAKSLKTQGGGQKQNNKIIFWEVLSFVFSMFEIACLYLLHYRNYGMLLHERNHRVVARNKKWDYFFMDSIRVKHGGQLVKHAIRHIRNEKWRVPAYQIQY